MLSSVAGAGRSTFDLTKALVNTQLRSDNEYGNLIGSVQAHTASSTPASAATAASLLSNTRSTV